MYMPQSQNATSSNKQQTISEQSKKPITKAALPDDLTPEQREEFEERAATMEYCGGLDRATAEREARACVLLQKQRQLFIDTAPLKKAPK